MIALSTFFKPSKSLAMKCKNLLQLIVISAALFITSCSDEDQPLLSSDDTTTTEYPDSKRTCLSHEHTQHLLSDPAYKALHEKKISAFEDFQAKGVFKAQCTAPVIIPVAVHFQGVGSVDASCLTNLAIGQINILNADFAGTNTDISKWNNQASSRFPGVSNGEACIRFVLADQNHPAGYGLSNGSPAVTVNRTQGDQVNNWSGYLNIFVRSNTGVLGYAPLGGAGNGDGVVIDAAAFGAGQGCGSISPNAPFNLGRTLTHEVGHYFLLDHIWGNGCASDDDVADTPDQSRDYSGCPALGASSCGSTDMHMNYMDYSNDACMYMFSAGQANRMDNYVTASLSNLTANASNVMSGSTSTSGGENTDDGGNTGGSGTSEGDNNSDTNADVEDNNTDDDAEDDNIACTSPTQSSVDILSAQAVRVDWADIDGADRYQVRYREVGTSRWTTRISTRSLRNLTGLDPTSYQYELRSRCADGWKGWSGRSTFDLSIEDNDGDTFAGFITVSIILDDFGSENSWELYNSNNRRIAQGGPYRDGQSGRVINKRVELTEGCYEIDLFDAYGDGMCCEYGNGGLKILNSAGSTMVESDGRFGTYELIEFCVEEGRARIINRDKDSKQINRGSKSK